VFSDAIHSAEAKSEDENAYFCTPLPVVWRKGIVKPYASWSRRVSDETKEGENFKGWTRRSPAVAGNICYRGPSASSHNLVVVVGLTANRLGLAIWTMV
jgi:hypothetical protein